MSKMKIHLTIAALIISGASLRAATPIQLSLTPDIALYPKDTVVRGLALNIWGENPQSSLHLGFVNGCSGESAGLSYGLVNYADSYTGVLVGWVNISTGRFAGLQDGWFNWAGGDFTGLQYGVVNIARAKTSGLQLGLVNYAARLDGLQIGLVNIAAKNPAFTELPDKLAPVFPILNWSF